MSTEVATVTAMLERAAGISDHGLRLVERDGGERWLGWVEIFVRAQAAAGALARLGIEPGDRVALVYPTCAEFFDAFFGVLLAGAVPVPLYPPVRLGRLAEYQARTAAMLEAAAVRLVLADPLVRRVLGPAIDTARPQLGCRVVTELDGDSPPEVMAATEDLALVQFSSGTTVDPKPVALSHRALVAQATILNRLWPDRDGIRHSGVSWLPLYHDMGLIGCILPAIERPGTLTLIPPEVFVTRPAVWLRTISRYRATVSPAPNFAYGLCVEKIRDEELDGVDLSCWRVALNGAEAVAPEVLRSFSERFSRWGFRREALTPVYGLSEAALAVSFSDLGEPFSSTVFDRDVLSREGRAEVSSRGRELVSVGRALPGFEIEIVDGEGARAEIGSVGRIKVRGPSLMEGYLHRPRASAEVLHNGWLDTGDLGFMHHGELYLTGRAKDLLILRGRNHPPEEVEQAVADIPGVRSGCVVAVSHMPEGASGEQLVLLVEAEKGAQEKEFPLIAEACRRQVLAATGLASDKVEVLQPGTLPRTSSGKLRRAEALRSYLTGELLPPAPVNAWRMAGAVARSQLAYARLGWEQRERKR